MAWIAVEPVPMMPTRFPASSTPSAGQSPVWKCCPWKRSRPGKSGTFRADRQPVAMRQYCAVTCSPPSSRTLQRALASSQLAASTRVSSWMSRRRSKRSATWFA
jgi:hypothetical protein